MPALRIQRVQMPAPFHDRLPAAPQLVGRRGRNRPGPEHAGEIIRVARPIAGLDQRRGIEDKRAKARAFDRRSRPGEGILTASPKLPGKHRDPGSLAVRDRLHHAFEKNIELARQPELPHDPFEVGPRATPARALASGCVRSSRAIAAKRHLT